MEDILRFDLPVHQSSYIKVIGVGGGGSNAVNHMYKQGIKDVDFVVCNTDRQALDASPVPTKVQLGKGLGAGNIPGVAHNAAMEKSDDIKSLLDKNTKMLFITAGMGGGTGTGAAPVIASLAKEIDLAEDEVNKILTVAIVTTPFSFEGRKRIQQAQEGIAELRKHVDAILIINNDKLREFGELPMSKAFAKADDILTMAAKGISEIITVSSYVQIDFKDVNTVMANSGVALMGFGIAEGENRALEAVKQAINSPLLNDNNIEGAKNILLYISSGTNEVTMDEIEEITNTIRKESGREADLIWGAGIDERLGENISITLVATGFKEKDLFSDNSAPMKHVLQTPEVVKQPEVVVAPVAETVVEEEISFVSNTIETTETITEMTLIRKGEHAQAATSEVEFPQTKTETPVAVSNDPLKTLSEEPYLIRRPATTNEVKNVEESKAEPALPAMDDLTNDRISRLRSMSQRIRSEQGLKELETVPAYMRRNMQLSNVPHSSESEISRFSLNENGQISNNSYLHDNVD